MLGKELRSDDLKSQQNSHSSTSTPITVSGTRIEDLTLGKELGRGSFAKVYRAVRDDTNEVKAVKKIERARLSPKLVQNLESEIGILRNYHHANIVALDGIFKTSAHIYLVLEYCGGGDLHRFIKRRGGRLPEPVAQHFMCDLADGLAFLHERELIHRDIKPQNLLLTAEREDAQLKIADFGFARHLSAQSMADTLCGSPLYMAPEILMGRRYDSKADLWSVGTVLWEMLTGRPPYGGANQTELVRNIRSKDIRLPTGINLSSNCIQMVRLLLQRKPENRANFSVFLAAPFLNRGEVNLDGVSTSSRNMRQGESYHYSQNPSNLHKLVTTNMVDDRVSTYHHQQRAKLPSTNGIGSNGDGLGLGGNLALGSPTHSGYIPMLVEDSSASSGLGGPRTSRMRRASEPVPMVKALPGNDGGAQLQTPHHKPGQSYHYASLGAPYNVAPSTLTPLRGGGHRMGLQGMKVHPSPPLTVTEGGAGGYLARHDTSHRMVHPPPSYNHATSKIGGGALEPLSASPPVRSGAFSMLYPQTSPSSVGLPAPMPPMAEMCNDPRVASQRTTGGLHLGQSAQALSMGPRDEPHVEKSSFGPTNSTATTTTSDSSEEWCVLGLSEGGSTLRPLHGGDDLDAIHKKLLGAGPEGVHQLGALNRDANEESHLAFLPRNGGAAHVHHSSPPVVKKASGAMILESMEGVVFELELLGRCAMSVALVGDSFVAQVMQTSSSSGAMTLRGSRILEEPELSTGGGGTVGLAAVELLDSVVKKQGGSPGGSHPLTAQQGFGTALQPTPALSHHSPPQSATSATKASVRSDRDKKLTEALALYLKAMNLIKEGLVMGQRMVEKIAAIKVDRLPDNYETIQKNYHQLVHWLTSQFALLLKRAEKCHSSASDIGSSKDVHIEENIYHTAMRFARMAAVKEMLGQNQQSLKLYRHGLFLIKTLLMDEAISHRDYHILKRYDRCFRDRIGSLHSNPQSVNKLVAPHHTLENDSTANNRLQAQGVICAAP